MAAALQDPSNQRFVLLSEDSLPLYPAPLAWLQLVSEQRSRIDACSSPARDRMPWRWQPAMEAAGLPRSVWRKSSQWASFIRSHVELVVAEQTLNAVFAAECWATPAEKGPAERFCVSDEHYIPSLLAVRGLEGECACDGMIMHAAWNPSDTWHPRVYSAAEASMATLTESLREGDACNSTQLEVQAAAALGKLQGQQALQGADLADVVSELRRWVLPPRCPLFARKFAPDGADSWRRVLEPVLS